MNICVNIILSAEIYYVVHVLMNKLQLQFDKNKINIMLLLFPCTKIDAVSSKKPTNNGFILQNDFPTIHTPTPILEKKVL